MHLLDTDYSSCRRSASALCDGAGRLRCYGSGEYQVPEYESMRPILRSWCLYEIAETPAGALHVLVGTLNWKEHRHVQNAGAIRDFTTATSEAWVKADKDMIDNLVLKRFGSFEKADTLLRGLIGAAFSAYFAATPGQTHEGKPWVSFAKYYCDGAGRQAGDDSNTPASEVSPEQLDSLHLNL